MFNVFDCQVPANRAGHSAVSTGAEALVCGGYSSKTATSTKFSDNGNSKEFCGIRGSQVSSCPEGHDAADYQTYEFQEKFF